MAAVTIWTDFGAQESKVCHCFHCFPIYFPWSDGTGCHDLSFLNVDFKPTFSLSSFTFIKRLFSSSLVSAIRVVLCAYMRLLIFFPAILIPACASASLAFHTMQFAQMMCSLTNSSNYRPTSTMHKPTKLNERKEKWRKALQTAKHLNLLLIRNSRLVG